MYNHELKSRQSVHRRCLCMVLACLLIISSIPLQEIAVDAVEETKELPAPLSLRNDDRISQDHLIEIELDPSIAESESRWVLTLPDGLVWLNEEADEHLEYIAEKSELHSKALTETQSFVFQVEHPGTYTLAVSSFNLNEEEIIYEAFVFERAQQEAPPIETDEEAEEVEEVEEVEETEPDEIAEEEIDNIEQDELTEPEPIVPAPDQLEQIDEDAPKSSPIVDEEDQKETVEENDKEKHVEAPLEEQKPVEENTTNDDEDTVLHEETFPSLNDEEQASDLEQQIEEVKNRFTTSAIEVSNVNAIPNPPVSGPNVGELFTFAGDRNVAQHRSSNVRVLADGTRNKSSAMWFNEQLDLNQSFQTSMYLYINGATPNQTQIADGLTFTMHGDGRGLQAIGQNGESLGAYGTIRNSSYTGFIQRALSFEFDTYHNGDFSDRGMRNQSHTAVVGPNDTDTGNWWWPQNRRMVHSNVNYRQIISSSWQPFTVQWEKGVRNSGTLSYTFAGQTTRYEVSNYQTLFGGNRVHWGFTGATGQEVGMYAIAYADLPQRPRAQKTVRNVTSGETRFQEQSTAYPGDILEYELTLENPAENGLGAVWPNVQVTDPLPNGLTYVANGSRDKPSRINGQRLTFNPGDIGVGQSKTVRFRVQVDDRASGSLMNQAYATATSGAFQGEVSTNESTITLNKIRIEADAVPQTFSAGTDPTTWKATDFVKNIRIKPDLLNQSVRVVGFTDPFPDVSKPGSYSVGVKIESTIYANITQIIQVPVTIVDGALSLVVPDLDFGTQTISSRNERYFGEVDNGELIITDTRYVKNRWSLAVQQQQPFRDKTSGAELSANLFYIDNDSQQLINEHAAVIARGQLTTGSTAIISKRWRNDKDSKIGFFLDVPAGTGNVNRSYETEITWTLQDVPANE